MTWTWTWDEVCLATGFCVVIFLGDGKGPEAIDLIGRESSQSSSVPLLYWIYGPQGWPGVHFWPLDGIFRSRTELEWVTSGTRSLFYELGSLLLSWLRLPKIMLSMSIIKI